MRGTCRIRVAKDLGGLEMVEARHPEPRFGRHAHPTYAIGVVTSGINRFRYRGEWVQAPAGAICTVTPDEPHEVEPAGKVGFAYRCLYPSETQLRAAAAAVAGRKLRRTLALPPVISDEAAAGLISALFDMDGTEDGLARETRLAELLMRVTMRHALEPVASRAVEPLPRGVSRAREYLADNAAENVSLTDLATISAMDPFALVRGFTRAYGIPPHAWLVQQRVRRAKELLRAGQPLAEVAAALGFADQSHLTRHFKRLLGFTPGRYRRAVFNAGPLPTCGGCERSLRRLEG
ncbi:MAG: AraC family transcriptional regulator [Anaeromyxobacteraceae bacterium]